MRIVALIAGLLLAMIILWDGFETIVLPRRVTKSVRFTRQFYRMTWAPWSGIAQRVKNPARRDGWLSYYGPLSVIMLLGVWAVTLVVAFGVVQWSLGSQMQAPEGDTSFWTDLYMSGVTFFTLGFGDVIPLTPWPRLFAVVEAGLGFGFLAVTIGYLPVMYQAFSQREINVSLLDERAGSPPCAAEMLIRSQTSDDPAALGQFLQEWERWAAELLEGHLSFPVLGYFRSQHDNQSWLSAITMILDSCALVLVGIEGGAPRRQAQLTFAMARHAVVDLTQVYNTPPLPPEVDRLPDADLSILRSKLEESGCSLRVGEDADRHLTELRRMYEPYVHALSHYLMMALPAWLPSDEARDVWQITAWEGSGTGRVV